MPLAQGEGLNATGILQKGVERNSTPLRSRMAQGGVIARRTDLKPVRPAISAPGPLARRGRVSGPTFPWPGPNPARVQRGVGCFLGFSGLDYWKN